MPLETGDADGHATGGSGTRHRQRIGRVRLDAAGLNGAQSEHARRRLLFKFKYSK